MSGYLLEMSALLLAMKEKLLASSAISYLHDVRIRNHMWDPAPWSDYSIYLWPVGSPETSVAEHSDQNIKFATHTVNVDVVRMVNDPYSEDAVVGRTNANVGITEFASDVADFLENNFLGLIVGIDLHKPPTIEFGDNAFAIVELDQQTWLHAARGVYRATTRPFERAGA